MRHGINLITVFQEGARPAGTALFFVFLFLVFWRRMSIYSLVILISMLDEIREHALRDVELAKDIKALEDARVKYIGRKGALTEILRTLKDLSIEERRTVGPLAQQLKNDLEEVFEKKYRDLSLAFSATHFDVTRPGKKISLGHLHPLTLVERQARTIFTSMNFSVIEGPEVETEYYNFDALNIPAHHPAREMWDTFWLKRDAKPQMHANAAKKDGNLLMRTHTSPVQIRYMEMHEPPFQIISSGRVFRYEATDATHEINFYQLEGLMVGKDISLANFKFVVEAFFKKFFGDQSIEFRYRPSYFPFVEPGVEVDIRVTGKLRRLGGSESRSGASGWLEVLGAGMVHPKVFDAVKYNPRAWKGFAFGMGLDRLAAIKYNIPDVRLLYSGDARFVRQF